MIGIKIAALIAAAATVAAPNPAGRTALILSCDVGPGSGVKDVRASNVRVFRLAPRTFQEWNPDLRRFGNNLCQAYACSAENGRLRGAISSASLTVTVEVDPATGAGGWRTTGASGRARTSGSCQVLSEDAWRAQTR